jgi:long-subunit fatty acid transport protein
MRTTLSASFLSLILVVGVPSSSYAGGLYLNEFATPSMGTAGAGQEAYAHDASTNFALHNPAGMTRLDGNQVSLGAVAATRRASRPSWAATASTASTRTSSSA